MFLKKKYDFAKHWQYEFHFFEGPKSGIPYNRARQMYVFEEKIRFCKALAIRIPLFWGPKKWNPIRAKKIDEKTRESHIISRLWQDN